MGIFQNIFSEYFLECYRTEVAVNQHAILSLEVELTSLLSLELDNEEVVIAFIEEEVVTTVHKGGEQFLLTIRVQTVVSEVHHILHVEQFRTNIFKLVGVIRKCKTQTIHIVQALATYSNFYHIASSKSLLVRSEHEATLHLVVRVLHTTIEFGSNA